MIKYFLTNRHQSYSFQASRFLNRFESTLLYIKSLNLIQQTERICAGQLFSNYDTSASESVPQGLCLLARLSLLLCAWGVPKGECRQGEEFMHLPCMNRDSCAAPIMKRLCAIFWYSGMSDKSQKGFLLWWWRIKETRSWEANRAWWLKQQSAKTQQMI